MRENRDVETQPGEIALAQRREARIGEARLRRVGDCILDERPSRRGRADATAQLAVLGQRDESRPPRRKRRRLRVHAWRGRLAAVPGRLPKRGHAGREQKFAIGLGEPRRGGIFERERAVADDPRRVGADVGRSRQMQAAYAHVALGGDFERAPDGQEAAGPAPVERLCVKRLDPPGGVGVDRFGGSSIEEMREVGGNGDDRLRAAPDGAQRRRRHLADRRRRRGWERSRTGPAASPGASRDAFRANARRRTAGDRRRRPRALASSACAIAATCASPSGVRHFTAGWTAIPRKATRWAGPMITIRRGGSARFAHGPKAVAATAPE